jgi:hypothetical protein
MLRQELILLSRLVSADLQRITRDPENGLSGPLVVRFTSVQFPDQPDAIGEVT